MNITRNNIDDLNALLTVSIDKQDYKEKVEKTLDQYRKTANIKGFRKGQVPMSFVRKQFEKSIIFDEVNQLLQNGINEYIQTEKISILGNPLPKTEDNFNWDADTLNFDFELGLAPEFAIDLSKVNVEAFKVNVTEEEIQKYINNFAQRFGTLAQLDSVEEAANIKVEIKELDADKNVVEGGVQRETFLFTDEIAKSKKFIGKKVGDVIVLKAKELSEDNANLESLLEMTAEQVAEFKGLLQVTILEITKTEASPVDQSLFDKVYGEGNVTSEEEFRQKVKEESEKMYARETDRQLMNEVVENLVKETKFNLPIDFLTRWLEFSNEKIESIEQASEELKKMEDSLRYQLIEAKIAEAYDLKVEAEDVKEATRKVIREQLAMYGQSNISDEDLESITNSSLGNQQEFQRMADQVFADKMLAAFKDNVKVTEKPVTFDEFVEIMTEKNKRNQDHQH